MGLEVGREARGDGPMKGGHPQRAREEAHGDRRLPRAVPAGGTHRWLIPAGQKQSQTERDEADEEGRLCKQAESHADAQGKQAVTATAPTATPDGPQAEQHRGLEENLRAPEDLLVEDEVPVGGEQEHRRRGCDIRAMQPDESMNQPEQ